MTASRPLDLRHGRPTSSQLRGAPAAFLNLVLQFCVVGHDFGAVLAWRLSMQAPARVQKLVVLSVGHPGRTLVGFSADVAEAEQGLAADDWALLRPLLQGEPAAVLDEYFAALSQPGRCAGVACERQLPPGQSTVTGGSNHTLCRLQCRLLQAR